MFERRSRDVDPIVVLTFQHENATQQHVGFGKIGHDVHRSLDRLTGMIERPAAVLAPTQVRLGGVGMAERHPRRGKLRIEVDGGKRFAAGVPVGLSAELEVLIEPVGEVLVGAQAGLADKPGLARRTNPGWLGGQNCNPRRQAV